MIDPLKLNDDFQKANEHWGDFCKGLREIWHNHPEEYSEKIVKYAKDIDDGSIEANVIHAQRLNVFVFVDQLSDYILNEWKPNGGSNGKSKE
jgi:hypothetical protein